MALNLQKIASNTYLIPSPANIGLYVRDEQAILIDSGNDKEAGRQILKLLNEKNWKVKLIVNTHSNADHLSKIKLSAGLLLPELRPPSFKTLFSNLLFFMGDSPMPDLLINF